MRNSVLLVAIVATMAVVTPGVALAKQFAAPPIPPTSAPEGKTPGAPPPAGGCPESTLCLFQNSNWEGTRWNYGIASYSQNEWHYVGAGANDQASSTENNRLHSSYISQNYLPGSGGTQCLKAYTNDNIYLYNWTQNGQSENDSVSGFALLSYVGC